MKQNVGYTDRIIRIIIAIIFALFYFTKLITGTAGIVMLILSGILFLTAFIKTCPLYLPFGINTCKTK